MYVNDCVEGAYTPYNVGGSQNWYVQYIQRMCLVCRYIRMYVHTYISDCIEGDCRPYNVEGCSVSV